MTSDGLGWPRMMTPHRFEQGFVGFVMASQCFVGFVIDSQGFVGFVMDSRRSRVSSRGGGGGSWRRRRRYQRGCCELEADDGAHRGRMRHRRLWRRHHRCHVAQRERARHRALSLRPQLQSRPGRSLEGGERATLAHVRLEERLEQQLRLVRNLEQSRGPRCAIAIRRNQTQSSVTIRCNHRSQSDAIIGRTQRSSEGTHWSSRGHQRSSVVLFTPSTNGAMRSRRGASNRPPRRGARCTAART